nr:NFX1-type zinc finger-containing protein 1-like [Cherax quadricarinatus]
MWRSTPRGNGFTSRPGQNNENERLQPGQEHHVRGRYFTGRGRFPNPPRGRGRANTQRGAQSLGDLSSTNDGNTKSKGKANYGGTRKKREHPMGYKALERMLTLYPDEVVMQLQMAMSGYDLLIDQEEDITPDKICLLMKVLSHASETRSNRENLYKLFSITFKKNFINRLISFSIEFGLEAYSENSETYFDELCNVLNVYANAMPTHASDSITLLLESCIMNIQKMSTLQEENSFLRKYQEIKHFLEEYKQRLGESGYVEHKKRHRGRWEDDLAPPNDFRELSVLPTAEDLNDNVEPFLRRNIVQGKYSNVNHYLDVQFRLLREDFVRPLRNGINEFRCKSHSQNRDIWIYENVKIVGEDIQNFEMIHYIKLNLPKNFKIESSKRLLFGNLLCLSNDNFCTLFLGSVCDRNSEKLKNGIIGVKFDSDIDLHKDSVFVMAETRSYFVAYKHVLFALQGIIEDSFPMESFIVHVEPHMRPPSYLAQHAVYDLRVMQSASMMKESEASSKLFKHINKTTEEQNEYLPQLQNVMVMSELPYWPTENALGLDDSQRRALRSALVSKLSIIQGPPGTGKTFIGLKISQVLLHNSQYWKNPNQASPILVVCFTNHALDQFLEGMSHYTNSIVRVGSRSKSEIIDEFQINKLVKALRSRKELPADVYEMNNNLMWQIRELESDVKSWRRVVQELLSPSGILRLDVFSSEDILPDTVLQQFRGMNLQTWLLDENLCTREDMEEIAAKSIITNQLDFNSGFKSNEDVWQEDLEDLYADEERDRLVDDEDLVEELKTGVTAHDILKYEIKAKTLEESLDDLRQDDDMSDFNPGVVAIIKKLQVLKIGLKTLPRNTEQVKVLENVNFRKLDFQSRWALYKLWLSRLAEKVKKKLLEAEKEFKRTSKSWREIKDQEYLHIMRHAAVVGMTTTGAATYTNVIQALQPSIVIIEEAAEILEAHVISSLTGNCQHLIMIGDHQQLQPSATVYELAKKFNLETSLFERMIKNKIGYETLEYQHRMRPSISRLLVPSIYPHLKDHSSVHSYPHVKGIAADVFFITHSHHENLGKDEDSSSHENPHEGELVMALCRHLMLQGYDPTDITILTPYTGQFFLLRKIQRKYQVCQNVRISVVDNFQGEESNIILLSLVRSNKEGKVGFLRTDNRVCVALSRAKHGLYIAGNMDQLKESSDLWKKIEEDLAKEGAIGKSLTLQCEYHHEQMTVTTYTDILTKSPEGGCLKPCPYTLPKCGHSCPKTCHMSDKNHLEVKCPLPCPKILCERFHPCPGKCWEACGPCMQPVLKTLQCEHTHRVRCSTYNNELNCPTVIEKELPACKHLVKIACYIKPETYPCPIPCDIRLECGHQCRNNCHVTKDPEHLSYKCREKCTKLAKDCSENHRCKGLCHEDCNYCTIMIKKKALCGHLHEVQCCKPRADIECRNKCRKLLDCGHHCPKKCFEECGGCQVIVKKVVPECQHKIQIECCLPPSKLSCNGPCVIRLECGHQCQARCNEPCTASCQVLVKTSIMCPKNHFIKVPCHYRNRVADKESTWWHCSEPCGTMLECEHVCKGQCGMCLHGRLHVACAEKCDKPLVCGHICKADCSSDCPPCQNQCPLRCVHSRCTSKCGEPCRPCQEKCMKKCKHQRCVTLCGEKCSVSPCEEACSMKLPCGHPCVGFCGDPCPPLCRTCDREELTEILFGSEDEDDARFVLLEDCGHTIEAEGLKEWLAQDGGEIGMKQCPRCKKPIYNNRRYYGFLLKAYKDVEAVKKKYFREKKTVRKQDLLLLLQDTTVHLEFVVKLQTLELHVSEKFRHLSDSELNLLQFQAQVIHKANSVLKKAPECTSKLTKKVHFVVNRVFEQKLRISTQMMEEVTCELQRLAVLPAFWSLTKRIFQYNNQILSQIHKKLLMILGPTVKFDTEKEKETINLLKESEKYLGGLGITNDERMQILKAMELKQGHWYKCPNNHIYCITECGGAMIESTCPECGAAIGGESHRLRDDNAVASEMDGAQYAAWSEENNMLNYDMDNFE